MPNEVVWNPWLPPALLFPLAALLATLAAVAAWRARRSVPSWVTGTSVLLRLIALGGRGRHLRDGANLARREIAILFEGLPDRTTEIEITGTPIDGVPGIANPVYASLSDLPVRIV